MCVCVIKIVCTYIYIFASIQLETLPYTYLSNYGIFIKENNYCKDPWEKTGYIIFIILGNLL